MFLRNVPLRYLTLNSPAQVLQGDDADFLAGFSHTLVRNNTINLGEKGIILSKPYVIAWVDAGAPLSHQDVACLNELAGKSFHSQTLPCAVSTISGTSRCFLVCHVLNFLMFPGGYRQAAQAASSFPRVCHSPSAQGNRIGSRQFCIGCGADDDQWSVDSPFGASS
jgi:hypothetical protein